MITEIELHKWKTHQDTKLVFQKGVNVIIGVMGAGKSSVMDAISFALFGTFPALNRRRVKLEGLIKSRPSRESEAEVRLSFVVGDDTYTVTRRLTSSGSTTARLDRNGSYLQAQAVRVNEEISSLLKVDYETFSRAVYSEQNGLDYFLTIARGERKRQIDSMLGLDQFAIAEENCTALINSIKEMVKDEESMLSKMDTGSLKRQLERLSEERKRLGEEQAELEIEEKAGERKLADIKSLLDRSMELYKRKERLAKEAIDLGSRVRTLRKEIEKMGAADREVAQLEEGLRKKAIEEKSMEGELEGLRKRERDTARELAGMQAEAAQNERRRAERDRIVKDLGGRKAGPIEKRINDGRKLLDGLVSAEAGAKSKKKETEEWIAELKKHIGRCPICERELDEDARKRLLDGKYEIVKGIGEELEAVRRDIESGSKQLKEAEEELGAVRLAEGKLKDYVGLDEAIGAQALRAKELAKGHDAAAEEVDALAKRMDLLKESRMEMAALIEAAKRRKGYEEEVRRFSEEERQKEEEMKGIDVDQGRLDALQQSFAKQSAAAGSVATRISANKKYMAMLDSQISEMVKQIDRIKSMELDVERKGGYLQSLGRFRSAISDTSAFLRNRLVESINGLMQGMWPELYPYSDYSRLRLSAKPDDYSLEAEVGVDGKEEWEQIEAVASGGERNIACLALRIALAMVIVPNLRWLILDEPTHNVDSNGIARLISVLSDSLPKVVDQIFIITHDDNLKQIAAAKIYQFDRDKGAGGPTIANEL